MKGLSKVFHTVWLLKVVYHSVLRRQQARGIGAVAAGNYGPNGWVYLLKLGIDVASCAVGQDHIEEDDVDAGVFSCVKFHSLGGGGGYDRPASEVFKHPCKDRLQRGLIFDHEHGNAVEFDALHRGLRPKRRRGSYTCKTNNYAVLNTPALCRLVQRHTEASEFFDSHPTRVERIPKTLAIQNRSLASQTALAWKRPSISREEMIESLERYRDLYAGWKLRRELRWAQPYVDRMAGLMDEIRVR